MYSQFLRAQKTSPTLSLAYANIGDDGILEIAHFLAEASHLRALDLSGNAVGGTGLLHLSRALKQNSSLESLVLKHNCLGAAGEAAVLALCRSLYENKRLLHLDLRHNQLDGALAATCIAELLENNSTLTHLELSWNRFDPGGGHVIRNAMRKNTTLLDCQLTGCGLTEETLRAIAELLSRNRVCCGAKDQEGPYEAHLCARSLAAKAMRSDHLALMHRSLVASENLTVSGEENTTGVSHSYTVCAISSQAVRLEPMTNSAVSRDRSNEMMRKLLLWQQGGVSSADKTHAAELYSYIEEAQTKLQQEQETATKVKEHTALLASGFQDRELRYRRNIAEAKEKMLDYSREHQSLMGIFNRMADELRGQRDLHSEQHLALLDDRKQWEGEEAQLQGTLASTNVEKREMSDRRVELQEKLDGIEKDNSKLREQLRSLRERVGLLNS